MEEEQGLQDASDILLDLLPAGLAAGVAGWAGKKGYDAYKAGKSAVTKVPTSTARAQDPSNVVMDRIDQAKARLDTLRKPEPRVATEVVKKAIPKTKYDEALHSYHSNAAKELGYKNVDDMYDDFYNKFDIVDSYTDDAFTQARDPKVIEMLDKAGIPESRRVQALSMDSVLGDVVRGNAKPNGTAMNRRIREDDVMERRQIPLKYRKDGARNFEDVERMQEAEFDDWYMSTME